VDTVDGLIEKHGGYRKLKSFQLSRIVYDLTLRFCGRYIERGSRTKDQMVQAARSCSQNIAEGSQAAGASRKTEIKLTNVARASLEELRLDYEDFLRQHGLPLWQRNDPRRQLLIDSRPASADDIAQWAIGVKTSSTSSTASTKSTYGEIAANGALALIAVACTLLDRQISTLEKRFLEEGGFTERMYRLRSQKRGS
jgi:four helix bundle suffix protein